MNKFALVLLPLLLAPSAAFADFGLPMLAMAWPLFTFAIVPVILLESYILKRHLNIDWRTAVINMSIANIYSTILGIPVAWIASLMLQIGLQGVITKAFDLQVYPPEFLNSFGKMLLTPAWLGPWRGAQSSWIVAGPLSILLIPFFFASYWLEAKYAVRALQPENPVLVRNAVWRANIISYLALFGCIVLLGIFAFLKEQP